MTITKTLIALYLGTAVGVMLFVLTNPVPAKANVFSANVISTATTSALFSVTTSARILATTTNTVGTGYTRVYASICTTATNPVAINLDGDKAANSTTGQVTAYIAAAAGYQSCYFITDINEYSGSITASSTNQTATVVTVKDYVQ